MADDDRPRLNAAHTFVVRDDVAGRDDPELRNTLTGSVVQHWPALDHINRHRRAGIFLALDSARCVLADFRTEEPRQALPVDPSLRVFCGYTHEWLPMYQFAWLVADDMPQRDRTDIAAMLRTYGAVGVTTGGSALLRLPGTHSRTGARTGRVPRFARVAGLGGDVSMTPRGWRAALTSRSEAA
jgi:hypothetical protein